MSESWSPEDEEGFGIRGSDEEALTEEQQEALDDLRVQTARESHEYLQQHPEVRAMLSLLLRETLLQERELRAVAGDLFRSERLVVAAVRRMLGFAPKQFSSKRKATATKEEEERASGPPSPSMIPREVTFAEELPHKNWGPASTWQGDDSRLHRDSHFVDYTSEAPRIRRRDTPAPWTQPELDELTRILDEAISMMLAHGGPIPWITLGEMAEGSSQDMTLRPITKSWMLRELESLTRMVSEKSATGGPGAIRTTRSMPWLLRGKSSSQLPDVIAGDERRDEEAWPGDGNRAAVGEEAIPLARRDTPAPWTVEDEFHREKKARETYVLGILEKILEEPIGTETVFEKLTKIVEDV